jgi:hypothetical protein
MRLGVRGGKKEKIENKASGYCFKKLNFLGFFYKEVAELFHP